MCESLYLSDVLLPLFPASAAQCLQPDCSIIGSALRAERILGLCYGWRSGGSDDGNDER